MVAGSYPDKLSHKHMSMVPLLAQPISNAQVVELLAMQGVAYSENRISIIRSSPLMQELVGRYQAGMQAMIMAEQVKESAQQLNEMVPTALDSLDELLRGAQTESVRLGAVKTVFDYAPAAPKAIKAVEASHTHAISIDSDAIKMVERALGETSDIIDVTPEIPDHQGGLKFSDVASFSMLKDVEGGRQEGEAPSLNPQPTQLPASSLSSTNGLISVEDLEAALAQLEEEE